MKYFISWLAMIMMVSIFLGSWTWWPIRKIANGGRLTQGEVVELFEKNHQYIRYKYRVGGQNFEGKMTSHAPNPSFSRLSIGQGVVIYYDLANPDQSFLGDPNLSFTDKMIPVLLAAIFVPTLVIARLLWVNKKKYGLNRFGN